MLRAAHRRRRASRGPVTSQLDVRCRWGQPNDQSRTPRWAAALVVAVRAGNTARFVPTGKYLGKMIASPAPPARKAKAWTGRAEVGGLGHQSVVSRNLNVAFKATTAGGEDLSNVSLMPSDPSGESEVRKEEGLRASTRPGQVV
jgi:hypothetical protein